MINQRYFFKARFDTFTVTETKLDSTFSNSQFTTIGYSEPDCFARNRNEGAVVVYVRENISSKVLRGEPNCYKILINLNCTDLVVTNSSSSFQNTKTISTNLSHFHKIVIIVLKQDFQRSSPMELAYRNYINFDRLTFKRKMEEYLHQQVN